MKHYAVMRLPDDPKALLRRIKRTRAWLKIAEQLIEHSHAMAAFEKKHGYPDANGQLDIDIMKRVLLHGKII